jgi:hypothetical protein
LFWKSEASHKDCPFAFQAIYPIWLAWEESMSAIDKFAVKTNFAVISTKFYQCKFKVGCALPAGGLAG